MGDTQDGRTTRTGMTYLLVVVFTEIQDGIDGLVLEIFKFCKVLGHQRTEERFAFVRRVRAERYELLEEFSTLYNRSVYMFHSSRP